MPQLHERQQAYWSVKRPCFYFELGIFRSTTTTARNHIDELIRKDTEDGIENNLTNLRLSQSTEKYNRPLHIDEKHFPYTNRGTVLGLQLTIHNFRIQVTSRQQITIRNL